MASSSRACAIKKCEISACAICHCCQQDLCLDHIREHRDQLNGQLTPLAHQINTFLDHLEHFTPDVSPHFQVLQQWRVAAHGTVEQFYERLCRELFEERKNATKEKISSTRNHLDQLIRKQAATQENIQSLTNDLRLIEQEIENLRNTEINLRPLVINENEIIPNNYNQQNQAAATRSNGSDFQIFVETNRGRKMFIMVKPSDTILEVKGKIQDKEGTPIENQCLSFVGKQLLDHHKIETYGIQNLNTVYLTFFNRKN